jgi:putative tricarboxylic transport membrane protein
MWHDLLSGLTALGSVSAIAYLLAGSLAGVFVGVIPGLSGVVILSIALPFVYHIDIVGVLALFLGVHAASYYSASISSILLNTPAHPEAFAITFDGYPMAARGEAGRALGLSATATCIGGLLGCVVLVGFIQIINNVNMIFHPPEYVALIAIALILISTLGTDSLSKALIPAGLGIMIASVGTSTITGVQRFAFGSVELSSGISLIGLALGCFVVPQMVLVFGTATAVAPQDMTGREIATTAPVALGQHFGRQVVQGSFEALRYWKVLIRGAAVGVITGIIPGIGGFAANFMSYGLAQQFSKRRHEFGTGVPEGIIAPEGSSLSKEAGGLIPLIGLGIPGGVASALFLAALTTKDVETGFGFASKYPTLTYEMVWVIALSGVIGTVAGALSAPFLARITRVRGPLLLPFILSISVVGAFVTETSFFTVMEVLVFGVIGFALRRLRYSLATLAIGLVLGPTLETNIYLTQQVFPGFTFLMQRPLADGLFAIFIGLLVLKAVQVHRDTKVARQAFGGQRPPTLYALLGLIVTFCIAAVSVPFVVYGVMNYDFGTVLMPVIGGTIAAAGALWRLPFDIAAYFNRTRSGPTVRAMADTGEKDCSTITGKAWGRHGQYTRELAAFGWFVVLVGGSYLFGFTIAVPVFCIAYGLIATHQIFPALRSRILFAVVSAVIAGAVVYEILDVLNVSFIPYVMGIEQ